MPRHDNPRGSEQQAILEWFRKGNRLCDANIQEFIKEIQRQPSTHNIHPRAIIAVVAMLTRCSWLRVHSDDFNHLIIDIEP